MKSFTYMSNNFIQDKKFFKERLYVKNKIVRGDIKVKINIINEIFSKLEIIPFKNNINYKIKSKENDYVLYYVPKDKPLKRIWQELKLHLYSKNIDDLLKILKKLEK